MLLVCLPGQSTSLRQGVSKYWVSAHHCKVANLLNKYSHKNLIWGHLSEKFVWKTVLPQRIVDSKLLLQSWRQVKLILGDWIQSMSWFSEINYDFFTILLSFSYSVSRQISLEYRKSILFTLCLYLVIVLKNSDWFYFDCSWSLVIIWPYPWKK